MHRFRESDRSSPISHLPRDCHAQDNDAGRTETARGPAVLVFCAAPRRPRRLLSDSQYMGYMLDFLAD